MQLSINIDKDFDRWQNADNWNKQFNMNKYILKWELTGIVFVFLFGALLHFVFEWSNESRIVAAFASVNESVWEHFKQGFWPMCLYAALEFGFIRKHTNNFLSAKAVAVYVIPAVTALIFYAYTAIIGNEILIVDILIFAVAITVGQLISYKIMTVDTLPKYANYVSLVFILVLAIILILSTFYPPHLPIFLDETGFYGIPPH